VLGGLPIVAVGRAERPLDVRWNREAAMRAIALYAEGWVTQTRSADEMVQEETRIEVHRQLEEEVERQLAAQG
jgi:hypothetical protein